MENTTNFTPENSLSLKTFRDLYKKPFTEQTSLINLLTDFTNDCDHHIAFYLHTNKLTVTLIRQFIIAYYQSNGTIFTPNQAIIEKQANTVAMNLAETGTLDENMLPTKSLIINAISPLDTNNPDKEDAVSIP